MKAAFIFLGWSILGLILTILIFTYIIPQAGISAIKHTATPSPSPLPTSAFSLTNAPSESIKGTIASMSGTTLWQSRIATQSAPLTRSQILQQGEFLKTDTESSLSFSFPTIASIQIFPASQLHIIQTLPTSSVFQEDFGHIIFTKFDAAGALSIRTLHLLTQVNTGSTEIFVDVGNAAVTISVKSGSVQVAYNDTNNVSSVTTISSGNEFNFDDTTRETTTTPIK